MNFVLICGISNSGKTTYSKNYDNVLHLDDYKSFAKCNEELEKQNNDVCVEGVYNSNKRRLELLKCVNDKAHKVCIWLNTPLDICINRKETQRSEDLMRRQIKRFEPPTYDEGWDEIIVI